VVPNPDQPRKHFSETALADLAASIQARGLLQPIVVRRTADGYRLLAGERRFRAAKVAGLDRVPALIREGDDDLEIALIENLQREDLSPLEEAEALAMLIERHGYSHREVADLLGKSRPYVSNTLALNKLPDGVKAELHRDGRNLSREILMGIARQETPEAAEALWRRLQLDTVSVRKFRAEKNGQPEGRPLLRDVFLAARRLNRTLRRLARGSDGSMVLPPEVLRVLRRAERLIQRQLKPAKQPG
jgi:ParB family chromosome partitioning protein